ncbi:hypothetical protein CL630_00380 [bacterium]|nr:hypothetical protein [bacterium]|tara:strand:+ start:12714 stop:13163 length:450 start_codon:yes stop_codon:yes gene_type:complete
MTVISDAREKMAILKAELPESPDFALAFALGVHGHLPLELFRELRENKLDLEGSEENFQNFLKVFRKIFAIRSENESAKCIVDDMWQEILPDYRHEMHMNIIANTRGKRIARFLRALFTLNFSKISEKKAKEKEKRRRLCELEAATVGM